ncbi:enoyl-CoA hydratase/isomerase family protein [Hydrogenophaga sp.]|jgi:enoyl-CoA hydratase|uniref:enoyl-CoA hydratase/isomerase family protein n=1 Tax=Hydrogenophaga sp. TaxID=1904254 RepID=UPI003F72AC87
MGQVNLHIEAGIAHLVLDAPPMNALDRAMIQQLEAHLQACRLDDAVRVVLLHGNGPRAFSAGSHLGEVRSLIAAGRDALQGKFDQDQRVFGALAHFPKPTLAAIEGTAMGGGLELAVCCDVIVAARGARLALPEILLGVFPGSGGTVRVTRRIGAARARRMMLLGDPLDVATALQWGLVDDMCDDGAAVATAQALAQRLVQGPQQAQQACKACIAAAIDEDEATALALSNHHAVELGFSADLAEGLAAFDARRKPVFGAGKTPAP